MLFCFFCCVCYSKQENIYILLMKILVSFLGKRWDFLVVTRPLLWLECVSRVRMDADVIPAPDISVYDSLCRGRQKSSSVSTTGKYFRDEKLQGMDVPSSVDTYKKNARESDFLWGSQRETQRVNKFEGISEKGKVRREDVYFGEVLLAWPRMSMARLEKLCEEKKREKGKEETIKGSLCIV